MYTIHGRLKQLNQQKKIKFQSNVIQLKFRVTTTTQEITVCDFTLQEYLSAITNTSDLKQR